MVNPTPSSIIAWCPYGTGDLTARAGFARVGSRNGIGLDVAVGRIHILPWSFLGVALSAMMGSVGLFLQWCPPLGDCCIPGWMWWCTYFFLWTGVVECRCTSKDLERGRLSPWCWWCRSNEWCLLLLQKATLLLIWLTLALLMASSSVLVVIMGVSASLLWWECLIE